ncbi:MAG: hypothetical protein JNM21_12085 [Taibaiella sp.]|nr:hypothetical protein [Taibaiella sp.]
MHKAKQFGAYIALAALIAFIIATASCRKLSNTSDNGNLAFSADTLLFDTVFTARGTSTRSVKIINKEKSRLNISSIRLQRGASSPYFINVNGESGKSISNIPIEANDSLYVFASVNIEPGNVNDPFIVEDRLIATVGDREFVLPVLGYGQDAIYITDSLLQSQTWTRDKPYVIVKNAYVAEGQTLNIEAGTRVYVHADSRLFVLGSLNIDGTRADSVVFQGDRIDRRIYFDDEDFVNGVGGEWGGIYIAQTSYNNHINYALLKNGGATTNLGESAIIDATLQVDPDTLNLGNGNFKLDIRNSIIRNSGGYGIFGYGGSIRAENCLVFASAKENVALVRGGWYQFYGCTIAGYASRISTATEKYYGVAAVNFFDIGNNQYDVAPLVADFKNCIIYGNAADEFFANKLDAASAAITLAHCLIKGTEPVAAWVQQSNNIFNENPLFLETNPNDLHFNDYHVEDASPAKGSGVMFTGMSAVDMEGTARSNPPTIGCYQ